MAGEDKSSLLPVVDKAIHHQQLSPLLDRLDATIPGHQAIMLALQKIYQENPFPSSQSEGSPQLHNYQPLSGVEIGGYPQVDVLTALSNLKDPYEIFPVLDQAIISADPSESTAKIVARVVTATTGIPTIWGTPGTFHNPDLQDPIEANMVPLDDDLVVYNWANEPNYSYYGNQSQIERRVMINSHPTYESTGMSAIVLNEARIDDPTLIQTPMHELGHVVEKKLGSQHTTEVIPSLYGLRAALSLANRDVNLAADAMINPIKLYNQVIFGTPAP